MKAEPSSTLASSPLTAIEWRNLAGQLLVTGANQLMGRGSGAVLAMILARSLGAAGQGQLTVASALVDLGCVLGTLGVPQANSYRVARDRSRLPALFGNSLLLGTVIGVLGVSAAIVSYARGDGRVAITLVTIALLSIPLNTLNQLLTGLTWGVRDVRFSNLILLGKNILPLAPVAVAVKLGLLTPTVAMMATACGLLFSSIASGVRLRAAHGAKPEVSYPLLGESLNYGIRWAGNSFLLMILDKSMYFLVAAIRSDKDTAYLWAAMAVSNALQLLPGAAASIVLPRLSQIERMDERWVTANRIGAYMTAVMALEALVLVVAVRQIVPLFFGAEYLPAISSCVVLCIAYVSEGMARLQYLFLAASGRHSIAIVASLLGGCVALAVAWALVGRYGALGAALGAGAGQLTTSVVQYFCARYVLARAA